MLRQVEGEEGDAWARQSRGRMSCWQSTPLPLPEYNLCHHHDHLSGDGDGDGVGDGEQN